MQLNMSVTVKYHKHRFQQISVTCQWLICQKSQLSCRVYASSSSLSLQSNQVKRAPQDYIDELII